MSTICYWCGNPLPNTPIYGAAMCRKCVQANTRYDAPHWNGKDTVTLTVHSHSDGYVYAVEPRIKTYSHFDHWGCAAECTVRLQTVRNVPMAIERLCLQGTSDQWYSDGYEAERVLAALRCMNA